MNSFKKTKQNDLTKGQKIILLEAEIKKLKEKEAYLVLQFDDIHLEVDLIELMRCIDLRYIDKIKEHIELIEEEHKNTMEMLGVDSCNNKDSRHKGGLDYCYNRPLHFLHKNQDTKLNLRLKASRYEIVSFIKRGMYDHNYENLVDVINEISRKEWELTQLKLFGVEN